MSWHGDRLTRRSFLRLAALAAGSALLPGGLPGAGAPQQPASLVSPCVESLGRILDLAATAEALALTFYYRAVQSEFFVRLPAAYQAYFRTALDQERFHFRYLVQNGATPLATQFYFPPRAFGFNDFSVFVATIEKLETEFMSAYLAAARRFTEMDQPVLAEIAGQIVGIEAEHRILGRELAGNTPPPPNNLCFERATLDCVSQTLGALSLYLTGAGGYQGPLAMPTDAEVDAAVQGFAAAVVPFAQAATCQDTVQQMLDIAAVAEALGITFYYHAIQGGFFHALPATRQWYFQAALSEEATHLAFLRDKGAAAPPTRFFFPPAVFDDVPTFLDLLETLESAFIAAYLAAMQRFAQLGQPLLAQVAGQILGVEAEHRVLGRITGGRTPASDRVLARASFACVADAATALAPFLTGSDTLTLVKTLPDADALASAIDRFGCAAVPTAAYRVYFPHLAYHPPTTP